MLSLTENMVLLALASAAAALSFALAAWWGRCSRRATYDRPPITWNAWFAPSLRIAIVALRALAVLAMAVVHPLAGVIALALFAGEAAFRRWRGSETSVTRRLRSRWDAFCRGRTSDDPAALRHAFVLHLHPEWGHDLAGQLANDCAEPDELVRWIVKLEGASIPRR